METLHPSTRINRHLKFIRAWLARLQSDGGCGSLAFNELFHQRQLALLPSLVSLGDGPTVAARFTRFPKLSYGGETESERVRNEHMPSGWQ